MSRRKRIKLESGLQEEANPDKHAYFYGHNPMMYNNRKPPATEYVEPVKLFPRNECAWFYRVKKWQNQRLSHSAFWVTATGVQYKKTTPQVFKIKCVSGTKHAHMVVTLNGNEPIMETSAHKLVVIETLRPEDVLDFYCDTTGGQYVHRFQVFITPFPFP